MAKTQGTKTVRLGVKPFGRKSKRAQALAIAKQVLAWANTKG